MPHLGVNMNKIDFQKNLKHIYFPALVLSILLAATSALFHQSQNTLIGKDLGFSQISALKVATIVPQLVLGLTLLLFSIYKPFEKVFKGTLLSLLGVAAILVGFAFFHENLEIKNVSEGLGSFQPLVAHWPLSLLYIVLNLLNFNLFSFLIWGFINRVSSPFDGIKFYIPLAFALGLTGMLGSLLRKAPNWSLLSLAIPALALMICSILFFNWIWKKLPVQYLHPEEPTATSKSRFPYLTAAYLLAGGLMVKRLLDMLLKQHLRTEFQTPDAYVKFVGKLSMSMGSSTIAFTILWVVLGTWLILKKGWRTTAILGATSILLGWAISVAISASSESTSWLNQGILNGLLLGTTYALFFPLLQMLYLYLPFKSRLKTKAATELITLPLLQGIPSLATQTLLLTVGSISVLAGYIKLLLVPILMILLLIACWVLGKKFLKVKN